MNTPIVSSPEYQQKFQALMQEFRADDILNLTINEICAKLNTICADVLKNGTNDDIWQLLYTGSGCRPLYCVDITDVWRALDVPLQAFSFQSDGFHVTTGMPGKLSAWSDIPGSCCWFRVLECLTRSKTLVGATLWDGHTRKARRIVIAGFEPADGIDGSMSLRDVIRTQYSGKITSRRMDAACKIQIPFPMATQIGLTRDNPACILTRITVNGTEGIFITAQKTEDNENGN